MLAEKYPLKGFALYIVSLAIPLCTFMETLDLSIANVAIPYIAGDLGVSINNGTWVVTFFMVGNAIVLPISGWLTEKIGPIRLILISSSLFGVISFFCGIAPNFPLLSLFRFLQGLSAGPLIPLSQMLLIRVFPKGKENMAMALWAMVLMVGPIAGPVVGGWITESYSWRWIFFINVPVAVFAFLTILFYMRKYLTAITRLKLDLVGLILLCVGITCLQIFLDQGRQLDWFESGTIRLLFAVAVICLSLLVAYEWVHPKPLVDVKLFKIPSYALGTFLLAVSFTVIYAPLVITPLWLEDIMGYTALKAGICLATMGILPFVLAPVVGKLMGTGRFKLLYGISLFLMAIAAFYYSKFNLEVTFSKVAWSRFYFGIGLAFYIAPASTLPLIDVPDHQQANAAGIMQFLRIFLAGAGTAIYTTLWVNRATFHHQTLGSELTEYSPALQRFKQMAINGLQLSKEKFDELLNNLLDQQAYMISTNEIMRMTTWILVFLLFVLFWVKTKKAQIPNNQKNDK